jgi:hypothetical protein
MFAPPELVLSVRFSTVIVTTTKFAVIVPLPPIVAVVDADAELPKVMDPVLLLHEEKT